MIGRKGTELGEAITKMPALILVFVIMFLFVILSGIIAKNHESSLDLSEDFPKTYLAFDGKVYSVAQLLDEFCNDLSLGEKIGPILGKHFTEEYGTSYSFVLSYVIREGNNKFYSWSGPVKQYLNENGEIVDYEGFNKFFDPDDEKFEALRYCNRVDLHFRRPG